MSTQFTKFDYILDQFQLKRLNKHLLKMITAQYERQTAI